MKMPQRPPTAFALLLALSPLLVGCEQPAGKTYRLEQVAVIEDCQMPESVLVDARRGRAYATQMVVPDRRFWTEDGKAFLTLLDGEGKLRQWKWKDSTPEAPLHEPKGMCLVGDALHVADVRRVVAYDLNDGSCRQIEIAGAQRINDMVAHDGVAYASDTGAGRVYKLGRHITTIRAPQAVNGITFGPDGRMYCVSWDLHEVYELDPQGTGAPEPFGLAGHFVSLDSIEVLDDGTFLVSDYPGNKVCSISPDRKTVTVLAKLTSPADFGLDRRRGLLYVPSMLDNRIVVYRLRKE